MLKAYWFDDPEDEENSSYEWICPDCGDPNSIGDDFTWNGKEGKYCTQDTYMCEHCESEKEHVLWRS